MHLKWSYKLWTDEANRHFVEQHYNWWVFKLPLPALWQCATVMLHCNQLPLQRIAFTAADRFLPTYDNFPTETAGIMRADSASAFC